MSCCKDVQTPEPVASLAIATDNKFWLIDATPDFTEQYNKARKEFPDHEFAGIFITHAHIGHYTGLMYLGKEAMNASKIPVYCLPRMAEFLKTNGPWSQLVDNENIVIKEIKAKTSISLSSQVSITPIAVPHRDEFSETAGYLIASQLKKTIYIPDIDKWDNWKESINDYVRLLDLIIIDGTFFAEGELPNRDMSTVPHSAG